MHPPHRRHRRPHERPGHQAHHHDPLANVEDWPTLLLAIRENPATLLGRESVSTLRDVLMGFGLAEIVYDVPRDVLLEGFDLHAFERWCDETYNPAEEPLHSFDLALRAADNDEAAGLHQWIGWVGEYLTQAAPD